MSVALLSVNVAARLTNRGWFQRSCELASSSHGREYRPKSYLRSVKKFTASGSFVSKVDVPGPLDTGDYCYQ